MADDLSTEVKCPICGAAAEMGAIYASGMRWISGPPSFLKNVEAAMAMGEQVGGFSFLPGSHALGIFCRACNRIVIDVPKPVNHYPDVRS